MSFRLLAAMFRSTQRLPTFREAGFRIYFWNDEDGVVHLILLLSVRRASL